MCNHEMAPLTHTITTRTTASIYIAPFIGSWTTGIKRCKSVTISTMQTIKPADALCGNPQHRFALIAFFGLLFVLK